MVVARLTAVVLFAAALTWSATFGTVVPLVGGAADIVLDEARGRLYLVNTSQTRIEVYSIPQRRFLNTIRTESLPLSAAMSRDGRYLYVAAYDASALNVIDLNTLAVTSRVSLPAKPEGVAVGVDGKVLISTIGTGAGNASNVLLTYDPLAQETRSLVAVSITPPPPQSPLLPAPSGRPFLTVRGQLQATNDGTLIVGVNIPNNNSRTVFVYEVASGTVLRSRTVANVSSTLAVSPDGSKFMAGLTLFDTETLQILAQQNAANAPWPFPQGTNFNTQQVQGGSVFSPNGSILYSAFNVTPVQNPPARPNVSQLMLNDPDNLLIELGIQMPENLVGNMVINGDGSTIYALSDSGFTILPVSTIRENPLAIPESTVALLVNDYCGVNQEANRRNIAIQNTGRGRMVVQAQLLQTAPTGPGGIAGVGGAGGGAVGGGIIIVLPTVPGRPGATLPPGAMLPGGFQTGQNAAIAASAPVFRTQNAPDGNMLDLNYSGGSLARNLGTVSPTHTLVLQSEQAINVPPAVRVFQNFRNPESRGDIIPIEVGLSANEALEDMVVDSIRQRLYIANSGKNRIEVFDMRNQRLLNSLKVGQLPRSLAITPDGGTMYVANSGGENVSIVDLDKLQVTGRVRFPALPFNSGAAAMTPSVIAAGVRGLQMIMSNGTIWRVVGNEAVPRPLSPLIGTTTLPAPRTMAATPNGEYMIVLAGNGFAYLYDSIADEFVQSRQIFSNPIQGFYGPIAAGLRGQYYLVNGTILNQSLTPIGTAGTVPAGPTPQQQLQQMNRPISAVAAASGSTFVRMAQPLRLNANQLATTVPTVELVDVNSGQTLRSGAALEGPISTLVGNGRVNINGRTMAVDTSGGTVYALTTSGLSVLPLDPVTPAERPLLNQNGTVSLSSYVPSFAPGSLVTMFGRNLATDATYGSGNAPTVLGGVCITLNNTPMPLLMTSAGQINAQIPPEVNAGRYQMVVRNIERKAASNPQQLTVAKFAPAVFADPQTKEALVFRQNGQRVTRDNPARRDEPLMLFATGLGVTKPRVAAGAVAPDSPLAETDDVKVYFGDPRYSQSEMIVDWSGLVPGFIGLYQLNVRVPGNHMKGDTLPVTLRIGGVDSQTTGPVVPVIAVQ